MHSTDAVHPLFNATLPLNQTGYCIIGVDNGSTVSESTKALSPSTQPLPGLWSTCKPPQMIARLNDVCRIGPNPCRALQCNVNNYYRIIVTLLPCGEVPAVIVDMYHLLEETTLLHKVYTGSKQEPVYLYGETRLFNMAISIDLSPNKTHITLMVNR